MDKATPSPYVGSSDPVGSFKERLLKHLELLHLPHAKTHPDKPCNKSCHLMEREHMINIIKQFVVEN